MGRGTWELEELAANEQLADARSAVNVSVWRRSWSWWGPEKRCAKTEVQNCKTAKRPLKNRTAYKNWKFFKNFLTSPSGAAQLAATHRARRWGAAVMWFVCPTLATFKKNSIGSTGTLPKGFGICMILHFCAFFFNRVLLAVFLFSCFLFHGKAHSEIERTCGGIKDWVQKLEGETPKDAQKTPRKLIKLSPSALEPCLEDSVQHHMATSLRIQPLDDVRHSTRCTVVTECWLSVVLEWLFSCRHSYLAIQNVPPCEPVYSAFGSSTNTSFFVALGLYCTALDTRRYMIHHLQIQSPSIYTWYWYWIQ